MSTTVRRRTHLSRHLQWLREQRGQLAVALSASNPSKVGSLIRSFELGEPLSDHWLQALIRELQPDPAELRRAFAASNLPQRPYQMLADARTGTMPDLGRDPLDGQPSPPVMTDSAWISLQNICNR